MSSLSKLKTVVCVILITLFWGVMMTLFIRQEFFPTGSTRIPLAVETVTRKILEYPEITELVILQGENILGYIRLNPTIKPGSSSHPDAIYHFLFSTEMTLPFMGEKYHLNVSARMDLDKDTKLQSFEGRGNAGVLSFQASGSSLSKSVRLTYSLDQENKQQMDIPFEFGDDLKSIEGSLPPEYREMAMGFQSGSSIIAYSTMTKISDENVLAYVIESKMDGDTLMKIWVTRFGQVYKIDTSYGIQIKAEEIL